jgi:hypothetical protein
VKDPSISILLPTVRPDLFKRSFDSIRSAVGRVPYEVVVVADFGPEVLACNNIREHLRCQWLQRPRRGPTNATIEAYSVSQGEYVFAFNDESTLDPNALEVLYDEASRNPWVLYSPRHVPHYDFVYYGKPFVPFPFMHRDLTAMLGGLFDPAYHAFYADPDLSMRAHAAGVPVRIVNEAVINHYNGNDDAKVQNVSRYMAADQATFRARWDHLGVFCDC